MTEGMHCFRNKTKNGQLDSAMEGEQKKQGVDSDKEFLTEEEMNRFLESAQEGQHSVRDYLMMLMAYRHGLRSSELVDLRLEDLNLETNRLYIRRRNGGHSAHHPIEEDELRALRAWLQKREQHLDADSPFLFLGERGPLTRQAINYLVREIGKRAKLQFHVNPHMLRHSTGYYLASRGYDTSLVQDYLGHKNVVHTLRYTKTAEVHFDGLWHKSTGS
jgi:type 1 fimbriae regulatory protein FimB